MQTFTVSAPSYKICCNTNELAGYLTRLLSVR